MEALAINDELVETRVADAIEESLKNKFMEAVDTCYIAFCAAQMSSAERELVHEGETDDMDRYGGPLRAGRTPPMTADGFLMARAKYAEARALYGDSHFTPAATGTIAFPEPAAIRVPRWYVKPPAAKPLKTVARNSVPEAVVLDITDPGDRSPPLMFAFLRENPDSIALRYVDGNYYSVDRAYLRTLIDPKNVDNGIAYGCRAADGGASDGNLFLESPMLKMNNLVPSERELCHVSQAMRLFEGTGERDRVFEMVSSNKRTLSTLSFAAKASFDSVSRSHCQSGQGSQIFYLRKVVFDLSTAARIGNALRQGVVSPVVARPKRDAARQAFTRAAASVMSRRWSGGSRRARRSRRAGGRRP